MLQLKTTNLKVVPIFSAPRNFNLILLSKTSAESCMEQVFNYSAIFFCESIGNLIAQK